MGPGEAAQESPKRRGGWHPLADDTLTAPRAQYIGIVDAVSSGQGRGDEAHRLGPHVGMPNGITEVDLGVDQLTEAQVAGQSHG